MGRNAYSNRTAVVGTPAFAFKRDLLYQSRLALQHSARDLGACFLPFCGLFHA